VLCFLPIFWCQKITKPTFQLFNFWGQKFVKWRKMLMKLRLGVNFINILSTNFSYKRHFSSYFLALSKNLYKKFVRLTLMKLTLGLATYCRSGQGCNSATRKRWRLWKQAMICHRHEKCLWIKSPTFIWVRKYNFVLFECTSDTVSEWANSFEILSKIWSNMIIWNQVKHNNFYWFLFSDMDALLMIKN